MCYRVRFITRSVKCMVTMRWVMAWLENGFGCSMEDERTCTMRREVGVRLWWMMIWCCKVNERVRDDRRFTISDLSLHFPQISRTLLYDIVSSGEHCRQPQSIRRVYKNLCPAMISASIMGANMWKNSLKNVESDNKILYENVLDCFLQWNGTYFLNKPCISVI